MKIRGTYWLVLIMIISLLSACSSGATTAGNLVTTKGSESSAGTTANPKGISGENEFPIVSNKVDLKVWAAMGVPMPENMDTCPQTIAYEKKTNVHITWTVCNSSEKDTMLNLSLASGTYPDIYATTFTTDQLQMMKKNGVIIPIQNLIKTYGFNMKKALADNPLYQDYLTAPDGNIYSFYRTDAGQHMLSTNKMFVYQPWLTTSGMKMPTTPDEFKKMLIYFRDNDMNGNGKANDEIPLIGSYSAWGGDPLGFLMNPFQLYPNTDYLYVNQSGKLAFAATADGWRDGLRYIHSLFVEGLLAEETYVQDATQLKSIVNKANPKEFIAGTVPGAYELVFVDLSVLPGGYVDFVTVPPLKGPTGLQQAATSGVGTFNFIDVITSQCKNPEVAVKWLDYWLSDEGSYQTLWGIEEQDFKWIDAAAINGEKKSIVRNYSKDGYMTFYLNSWSMQIMPMNDTAFNKYRTEAKPGVQAYELYTAAKLYEPFYKLTGWANVRWSGAEADVEEITLLKTPINEYVAQAYTEFILGKRDIDKDWDSYLNDLRKMGLDDYLALQAKTIR